MYYSGKSRVVKVYFSRKSPYTENRNGVMLYVKEVCMMTLGAVKMSADGLRAYLRTLRIGQGVTQEVLAKQMRIAPRTLVDYELGATAEMKTSPYHRAVSFLHGSIKHIQDIIDRDLGAEDGRAIAQEWIDAKRAEAKAMTDQEIVTRLAVLDKKLEEALARIKYDPELVAQLRAYAEGLANGRGVVPLPQPVRPVARRRWFQRRPQQKSPPE